MLYIVKSLALLNKCRWLPDVISLIVASEPRVKSIEPRFEINCQIFVGLSDLTFSSFISFSASKLTQESGLTSVLWLYVSA